MVRLWFLLWLAATTLNFSNVVEHHIDRWSVTPTRRHVKNSSYWATQRKKTCPKRCLDPCKAGAHQTDLELQWHRATQIFSTHLWRLQLNFKPLRVTKAPCSDWLVGPLHAAYSVNLKVTHDGTHWALARKNTDHLNPLHYRHSNLPQESPLLNHDCSGTKQRTGRA